jgi:hypothetical protein
MSEIGAKTLWEPTGIVLPDLARANAVETAGRKAILLISGQILFGHRKVYSSCRLLLL